MTPATKDKKQPDASDDLIRISQVPGAKIPLESLRWDEDQRPANAHFLMLLGELCGRCTPSAGAAFSEVGRPEDWLRLCDLDEAAIASVLRRIERSYPSWTLDVGKAETFIDRVDVHFATAMLRRRRSPA